MNKIKKVELLAPAGSPEALIAAINAGADSVYLGIDFGNMRANTKSFSLDALKNAVETLHTNNKKCYLTLNTIFFDDELSKLNDVLDFVADIGIDAVICWDYAVISGCKEKGIPIHISTQASISNSAAANYYEKIGVSTIVLARECTLENIIDIRKNTSLKIESFIHGALCIAVSGRCFMSQFTTGHSANRGDCLQPCRYPYKIKGTKADLELEVHESAVLSPKDLCCMPILDIIIKSGVDILKIEGRARSADYVETVVSAYRKAIDAYYEGDFDINFKNTLLNELKSVFNRGFSTGFFMGRAIDEWSEEGNMATIKKEYIGRIEKIYPKIGVAEISLLTNAVNKGDELMIIGENCGVIRFCLDSFEINHKKLKHASKGERIGVKIMNANKLKRYDKVFILKSLFARLEEN